ncbi:MAG: PH domain-containing protein [Candidatus Nomurabacteria bacterium]|jgi:hypothetical protein|nr:PH domain-containing protein [Candidatus Nomurabacteria bacterium]
MKGRVVELNTEEQADHDRSVRDYPKLDLTDDEYVVIDVRRSKIGLVYIWLIVILASGLFIATAHTISLQFHEIELDLMFVLFGYVGTILAISFGLVASSIYRRNYMILTNKRVFARFQNSPFAMREQDIELEHIEDISVFQSGILQILFNYGSIRLSTVGNEHTYNFTYSSNPRVQVKPINKIVDIVDEN